jgi:phosphoribosyl-dephospho-CoA transferase
MYSRHDLVWLTPEGWRAAAERAGPRERAAIEHWANNDWPATVRRHDAGSSAGSVALGVSLPPDPGNGTKPKIALHALHQHVARRSPPMALADALPAAPAAWRDRLRELDAATGPGCLRVYGSLALQAITGRPYLSRASDIDLLFRPAGAAQLGAVVELLVSHAVYLPLDGEVVFPCGDAVAWKEWRGTSGAARVLVKSIDGARLADRATLLATLETA